LVRVQKLDRSYFAWADHEPDVIFRGKTLFDSIGQVLVRYRDIVTDAGLSDIAWAHESGRTFNAVPLPACCWRTERFRAEYRATRRKAA
jgi:hypothetical protein